MSEDRDFRTEYRRWLATIAEYPDTYAAWIGQRPSDRRYLQSQRLNRQRRWVGHGKRRRQVPA